MQFKITFFALLAIPAVILPSASAAEWNKKLKVWNVGGIPSVPGFLGLTSGDIGPCCGIPNGGDVCGSFGPEKKIAMRAIYACKKGRLTLREVCGENAKGKRCVKNSRRKGKAFYPFVSGKKIVCVNKSLI
ncbi:hypothetical protein Q7P35_006640 [Cladosporium inversicolor]